MRVAFSAISLAVTMAACSNPLPAIPEESLTRIMGVERTITWSTIGFNGRATFRPDGTASLTIGTSGSTDTGTWRITGDTLCARWQTALRGKERCGEIVRLPDRTYRVREPKTGMQLGVFRLELPS